MPSLSELTTGVKVQFGDDFPPTLSKFEENVELWLTYLSQPQPWLKEYENLQNRALFLMITEHIGRVLKESTRESISMDCPDWLKQLIERWQTDQSGVITLNYDTLIERAALARGMEIDDIYPVRMADVRREAGLGSLPAKAFDLFKLHGSVNWYYSGAASFFGEVLYAGRVTGWGAFDPNQERDSDMAASDKVPLIVPPTSEKSAYFQHETLRQVWHKAAETLGGATRVYCLGYSLPITDLGIRFFLQHGSPDQKIPMYIVNIEPETTQRYQELIGTAYEIDPTYAGAGIEKFVGDYLADPN